MEKQINDPKILNYLIEQTNAKIDIFQNTDSFVLHTDTKERVPIIDSYENKQLENETAFLLQRKNCLVYYSLYEGHSNINRTNFNLKKTFRENINKNNVCDEDLEKLKNLIRNANKEEYEELLLNIKNPKFDQLMRSNPNFLRYILYHKMLPYLPDKDIINSTYRKLLCHNYSQNISNLNNSGIYENENDSHESDEENLYVSDDN